MRAAQRKRVARRARTLVFAFVALAGLGFAVVPTVPGDRYRFNQAAILTGDGRVLLAGGQIAGNIRLRELDLFDPSSGAWSAGPSLDTGRNAFPGLVIPGGVAFFCGGETADGNAIACF